MKVMRPEEGTSPEAEASPAEVTQALAPEGLLCVSCGYDLRGLPIDAKCPECGTSIRRSLVGDRLSGAEPNWLRMVTRGQQLLAWGWLLMLLIPASLIVVTLAYAFLSDQGALYALLYPLIINTFGLSGFLLCAIGVVLVTMQDPRESLQERTFSSRRLARAGMIGAFLLFLASLPIAGLVTAIHVSVRPVLTLLVLCVFTVGIVSYLRWVAKLLQRVPKYERAGQAMSLGIFLRWALPLTVVLLTWVVRRPGQPRPDLPAILDLIIALAGCAGAILWLLLIVKSVSVAILLFHAAGAFAQSLKQAIIEDEAQKRLSGV